MCGRFAFEPGDKFYQRFNISNRLDNLAGNSNFSPGQFTPVITHHSPNIVTLMKWGIGDNLFNARAESLTTKPTFRSAFQSQRCLVPANGFYEWQHLGTKKIPYFFQIQDRSLFVFAGLYVNNTYTIITTTPSSAVQPIHHRMPVIFKQPDESLWLDQSTPVAVFISLLHPYLAPLLVSPAKSFSPS